MEGLQRSTTSFRRQGSSGLVWDDKALTEEVNKKPEDKEKAAGLKRSQSAGAGSNTGHHMMMHRSPSNGRGGGGGEGGGGRTTAYRTVKVSPPLMDPPSPKVSGCGFCGIFGKPVAANQQKKPTKRKSR